MSPYVVIVPPFECPCKFPYRPTDFFPVESVFLLLFSSFSSSGSTLCRKKKKQNCFVLMVNGLLWEPYVLLLVDDSNLLSAFKALRAQTTRDTRKNQNVFATIVLKPPSCAVPIYILHLSAMWLNVFLHPIKEWKSFRGVTFKAVTLFKRTAELRQPFFFFFFYSCKHVLLKYHRWISDEVRCNPAKVTHHS